MFSSGIQRRFSTRKLQRGCTTLYILWLIALFLTLGYTVSTSTALPKVLQVQALTSAELLSQARKPETPNQQRARVIEEARKLKEKAKFSNVQKNVGPGGKILKQIGPDGKILKSDAAKKLKDKKDIKVQQPQKQPLAVQRELRAKQKAAKAARSGRRLDDDIPSVNNIGVTIEKQCSNQIKDDHESDVNCGGLCSNVMVVKDTVLFPLVCGVNKKCANDNDCIGECDMAMRKCKPRPAFYSCDKDQLHRDMNQAYFSILSGDALHPSDLVEFVKKSVNPDQQPVHQVVLSALEEKVEAFKVTEGNKFENVPLYWGYLGTGKWLHFVESLKGSMQSLHAAHPPV